MPPTAPVTRKPRLPQESEREILDAAMECLRERPFRDLSVNSVMERTGLKRPSFYVHFRDRYGILLRVVAEIGDELFAMSERWFGDEADPVASVHSALDGVTDVYRRHGPVLRAVAEAATDDPEVELAYRGLVDRFIVAATAHIREEQAAGRAVGLDAARTAAALVWLNERYLTEMFGRQPQADPGEVTQTLTDIWTRTLYSDQAV